MRLFFNLTNGSEVIRDDDGIDVADLASARHEVDAVIADLRRERDFDPQDWSGWRFEVMDRSGFVLLCVPLTVH
jgi:hypothetical protein